MELSEDFLLEVAAKGAGVNLDECRVIQVELSAINSREGVLSDFFRGYVQLEPSTKGKRPTIGSYFIKTLPRNERMREVVVKHQLAQREIVFYR